MPSRYESMRSLCLLIAVFLILSIGIGIAGYQAFEEQKERVKSDKRKEITAVAELKVDQISWWRGERLGNAAVAIGNHFVASQLQDWLEGPPQPDLDRQVLSWMGSIRERYRYEAVLLVDSSGSVRLSFPGEQKADHAILMELPKLLAEKKPFFSSLHRSISGGGIRSCLLAPISDCRNPDGPAIGALILRIDPALFLYPLIQSWPTYSSSAETLLVQREGNAVVYLNELRHEKNTALSRRFPIDSERLPAAMAVRGMEGVVEGVDYRGVPVLAALHHVPNSPWYLVAKVDTEEIYTAIHARAKVITILTTVLIAGAWVTVGLIWRHQRARFYRSRYEAETARLEMAQRYEYLTRYANDIFLLIDSNGKVAEANERAVASYGYTRDELLELNIRDLRAPDTLSLLEGELRQIREQDGFVFETVHRRKDGALFPVEASSRVINLGDGHYYWAIIRDLSERKKGEEARREVEERFRAIFREANICIVLVDAQARIVEANRAAQNIFCHTEEEMHGRPFSDFVHPADVHASMEVFRKMVAGEIASTRPAESRYVRKDGQVIWGRSVATAVHDSAGKFRFAVGMLEDISDARQAEEAIQTLMVSAFADTGQELFEEIAARLCEWLGCNCAIIGELVDEKTVRTLTMVVNGSAVSDLTYALTGTPCLSAVQDGYCYYPEGVQKLFPLSEELKKLGAEGYVGRQLRTRENRLMGVLCFISCQRLDLPPRAREVLNIIAARVSAEIERKRAEEIQSKVERQLRQAQKMEAMGTLAGGIAHDFNNILAAITGYTELTLLKSSKDDPARDNLEQVLSAANRAKDLVGQILLFSRQGDQDRKPVQVDLIVKEAIKFLRASLPATIEIRLDLSSSRSLIWADPTQIHQVIMNLCTNAAHAMREKGGFLDVGLSETEIDQDTVVLNPSLEPGSYLLLTVSDTGHGMDRTTIERIFDPFFTTKALGEGTGMGLAVVHGIVKGHGGAVTVYSEPGEGSSFHVYLPRIDRPTDSAGEAPVLIPRGAGRILFVDDERSLAEIASQLLEWLGYEVRVETSSEGALEAFRRQPDRFDLLITDYTMPHMTGAQLAKEILRIRPSLPIILCTGFSERITSEKAEGYGIREFIMKPFGLQRLAEAVQRAIASEERSDRSGI